MESSAGNEKSFRPERPWLKGLIADIHHTVEVGKNTSIWSFAVVLEQTRIGDNSAIGSMVYIGRRCRIGNNVRIQDKAHITDDVVMEDDVFVGPGVVTMDNRYPRSGEPYKHEPPYFESGCSIGAGAVILPGVRIGEKAIIGAGAVVTKNIPANIVVMGSPAIFKRKLDE
jgi:UDP-2-acetamido-3-amino-2,3-dideoxy-glucuronate N-acetyltransferase